MEAGLGRQMIPDRDWISEVPVDKGISQVDKEAVYQMFVIPRRELSGRGHRSGGA